MMTALQIEEYGKNRLRFLRRNRIRVEHRYCDTATLKCVVYEHNRGKVSWTSIDRFVKAQRNRVLCAPETDLPPSSGYKRFVSSALSRRMCENAALHLLRNTADRAIKAVLVDNSGDSAGLCEYLAEYCDPVYVITTATQIYSAQAEYMLSEMGASLRICHDNQRLNDADMVIAPECLRETLPCAANTLILTGEKPAQRQNAPAIYEYFFELPSKYQELCPAFLDDMYFASALYTMAGAKELGSEVFTRCGDGVTIHSRRSLAEVLEKRMAYRTNS